MWIKVYITVSRIAVNMNQYTDGEFCTILHSINSNMIITHHITRDIILMACDHIPRLSDCRSTFGGVNLYKRTNVFGHRFALARYGVFGSDQVEDRW